MSVIAERIVIAGAEGHLGQAAVRHFAAAGFRVLASARTPADAARVQALVDAERLKERVSVETADLADDAAVARLADVASRGGAPQALMNCAGGFRWCPVAETSVADFDFLVSANLRSSFLLARHFVPKMKAAGFGRLVFVSSASTLAPAGAGVGVYLAAKAGLNALVQGLAAEHKKAGVTVNAVAPTMIDTPANRKDMPQADPKDWVPVESLLKMAQMLVGPDGAVYNGAVIPLAGRL